MKSEELPRELKKSINRHLAGAPRRLATFAITLWRELLESRRETEQVKHEAESNLRRKEKEFKTRKEQCRKQLIEIETLTTLLKKKQKAVAEPRDWEAPLHLQNNRSSRTSFFLKAFRDQKEQEGADYRKGHTQVSIKCPECGLHFMVFTWWVDRVGSKLHCPECGGNHCGVIQTKTSKLEIFQVLGSGIKTSDRAHIQMKRQKQKRHDIHQ